MLNKQRFLTLGLYLKFALYRIPFYLGFGLERFHSISSDTDKYYIDRYPQIVLWHTLFSVLVAFLLLEKRKP